MLILATILIIIALVAIVVSGRFFCTWICPIGYLLKLTHRLDPNKIKIDCSEVELKNGRCTGCLKCVRACPMGAIKYLPKHPRLTPEYKASVLENVPQEISTEKPLVMGILNLSENSFYPDSITSPDKFMASFEELLCGGADIIDIGACSSKPGAEAVSEEEEWALLEKPLKKIAKKYPRIPLVSLDTTRLEIIRRALKILDGKRIIVNDISGADNDEMIALCAEHNLTYVVTYNRSFAPHHDDSVRHSEQSPQDVAKNLEAYFDEFVQKAEEAGLKNYILDPGLGFGGKSIEENYRILSNLAILKKYDRPILVGLSRKSMIYKYLDISPKESLEATAALNLFALQHGATIIRVHDPAQGAQAVKLHKMLLAK